MFKVKVDVFLVLRSLFWEYDGLEMLVLLVSIENGYGLMLILFEIWGF